MSLNATNLISNRTLFLNSDDGRQDGRGYAFDIGVKPIKCEPNQDIKITLQSFSLPVVWSGVNSYNNTFSLRTGTAGVTTTDVALTKQNYESA